MGKELFTAQQFIDAIPKSGGIVTSIALKVGCTRQTAAKYIEKYATVKEAYLAELESPLDMAESILLGNIQAAAKQQRETGYNLQVDSSDAKWLLSKKGKGRGYGDEKKFDVDLEGNIKTESNVNFAQLTTEQIAAMVAILESAQAED